MSFSKALKTMILAVVYPFWEAEAAETSKARFEPVASNIVSAINANDAEAFSKDFNAPMREALPLSAARQFLAQIQESAGRSRHRRH